MSDSKAPPTFDAAVDLALDQVPLPENLAGEPEQPADASGDESLTPSAPHLRAVKGEEPEPEDAPAQPEKPADPREERSRQRAQKYADFLDDIENNPALRKHVMSFWDGPQSGPEKPPADPADDDPLAEYDERDRSAIAKALERQEQKFQAILAQALAPFQEQMAEASASREFETLTKEHPDWKKYASKEDLAEARKSFPGLTLLAAYRMTGLTKELAAVRAHVSNADRQMAKVGEVLKRKHPADTTPRRHVKVEKPAVSWDEGFETAYARKKAAFGTPGR